MERVYNIRADTHKKIILYDIKTLEGNLYLQGKEGRCNGVGSGKVFVLKWDTPHSGT